MCIAVFEDYTSDVNCATQFLVSVLVLFDAVIVRLVEIQ